jgi:hypothetical protein
LQFPFKIQNSKFKIPLSTLNSQLPASPISPTSPISPIFSPINFSEPIIPQILHALYERQLYSLLVEGGACLHTSFLDSGLWDELQVEISPLVLGNGIKAPTHKLYEITELQSNISFTKSNSLEKNLFGINIFSCKNM